MKVKELAELLQGCDPEMECQVEGCDCDALCLGLEVVPESDFLGATHPSYVLLKRDPDNVVLNEN